MVILFRTKSNEDMHRTEGVNKYRTTKILKYSMNVHTTVTANKYANVPLEDCDYVIPIKKILNHVNHIDLSFFQKNTTINDNSAQLAWHYGNTNNY